MCLKVSSGKQRPFTRPQYVTDDHITDNIVIVSHYQTTKHHKLTNQVESWWPCAHLCNTRSKVAYQIGTVREFSQINGRICRREGSGLVGLDLFNDDTRPSGHISRPTQVNVSQELLSFSKKPSYTGKCVSELFSIISDRRIPPLAGIPLCKSQELSRREHSTSRLCSIHHDIPVTMHTPAAYGQWSVFDYSGDNQSVVLGTRYGIWWSWYGQFEVGWLKPLQLWSGAGTSSVAPVLVSQDRDLCHVQLHPTWFGPTSE